MGGYHVTGRRNNGGDKYIALESYFRVPSDVVADTVTQTYPEFIYSFWRGNTGYGMDVGLGYGFPGNSGKWKLFAFGAQKTMGTNTWQEAPTSIYLNEGDILAISIAINTKVQGRVSAEVRRGSQLIYSHNFQITDTAYTEMLNGCTFTRECLLASNGIASQYVNCGAQFRFAKWFQGTLYDRSGNATPFTGPVLPTSDDNGLLYRNKVCTYCIDESYLGKIYGCECATASFSSSLTGLTGDFTCVQY